MEPWTAPTPTACRVRPRVGPQPHARHARIPPRLVHLAPAGLGPADPGVLRPPDGKVADDRRERAGRGEGGAREGLRCLVQRNTRRACSSTTTPRTTPMPRRTQSAARLTALDSHAKATTSSTSGSSRASSWNAVMRQRNLGYPADLYLEGSDQHRGWFQSRSCPRSARPAGPLQRPAHARLHRRQGRPEDVASAVGNAIEVDDLLKEYGADVCRWWVCSTAVRERHQGATWSSSSSRARLPQGAEHVAVHAEQPRRLRAAATPGTGSTGFQPVHPDPPPSTPGPSPRPQSSRAKSCRPTRISTSAPPTSSSTTSATTRSRRSTAPRPRTASTATARIPRATQYPSRLVAHHGSLCNLLAPIMPHTADEAYRALGKTTLVPSISSPSHRSPSPRMPIGRS